MAEIPRQSRWYRTAMILACLLLLCLAVFARVAWIDLHGGYPVGGSLAGIMEEERIRWLTFMVSLGALVLTAVGTASTIILGWRVERRAASEAVLKIEQLQLELAEARRKSAGRVKR